MRQTLSYRALKQKIDRKLRKQGRRLLTLRGERGLEAVGRFYTVASDTGATIDTFVDLERFGRELGVMREGQRFDSMSVPRSFGDDARRLLETRDRKEEQRKVVCDRKEEPRRVEERLEIIQRFKEEKQRQREKDLEDFVQSLAVKYPKASVEELEKFVRSLVGGYDLSEGLKDVVRSAVGRMRWRK